MTIRKKLLYVNRQFVDDEPPKRDAAPPTLPLHPLAAAALRAHKKRQAEERLACPDGWARWELVSTTRDGKPKRAANIASKDMPALLTTTAVLRSTGTRCGGLGSSRGQAYRGAICRRAYKCGCSS